MEDEIIYNEQDKIVVNPDLSLGYLYSGQRIKSTATPIDDINKFAWDDDDYENVIYYHAYTSEELEEKRIQEEEADKVAAREEFLAHAAEVQQQQDEAICELYEMIIGG